MRSIIIGIAGGTGSGKTTITKKIVQQFGDQVSVLYHDDYYKSHDDMTFEERETLNYDHPNAFDTDLMISHLAMLRDGMEIDCPVYDYTLHNRSNRTTRIQPAKIIVVEGILIFENEMLCDMFDMKLYVDTDADVRILRRIVRDVHERGRSLDSVITQYLRTVKPMHEQFVEPSKRRADIIIPQGGHNQPAMDMVLEWIRSHMQRGSQQEN